MVRVAVRAEATLGEGPTWDPASHELIWVDILSCRIHTYQPATGRRTVRTTEQHVGAAKPRVGGGLVVNLRDGVGLYPPDDPAPTAGGARGFTWLHHDPVAGRRGNEAVVAPDGSLWAGSMRYDERTGGGALIRVGPDGSVATVLPEVTISNGTGWSPDGRWMYYVDTPTGRIDRLEVEGTEVRDRRPLVEIPGDQGSPDGLAVDAEGCLWVALWDGGAIHRYTPDGTRDRVWELPVSRPTSCAFGGPGLTDLYVTTARVGLDGRAEPLAGSLLVIPGAGQGLAQPPYGG